MVIAWCNKQAPGGAEFVPELVHNRSGVGSHIVVTDMNANWTRTGFVRIARLLGVIGQRVPAAVHCAGVVVHCCEPRV